MSSREARKAAERGAKFLDFWFGPDWIHHVDLDNLDQVIPDRCVVGQLGMNLLSPAKDWCDLMRDFFGSEDCLEVVEHGFNTKNEASCPDLKLTNEKLTDAWKDVIKKRREEDKPSIYKPAESWYILCPPPHDEDHSHTADSGNLFHSDQVDMDMGMNLGIDGIILTDDESRKASVPVEWVHEVEGHDRELDLQFGDIFMLNNQPIEYVVLRINHVAGVVRSMPDGLKGPLSLNLMEHPFDHIENNLTNIIRRPRRSESDDG